MPPPRDIARVALLALVLRLFAAWAIPLGAGRPDPNCAPDEWEQVYTTRDLATGRFAPWPEGESIYATYLPSQYAAQAATLAAGLRLGDATWPYRSVPANPLLRGYPYARLGSVLLGVVAVLATMAAAARWWMDPRAARRVGLAVALYPQMVFVSAYVNGDAWTLAAGALLLWALAAWARSGEGDAGLAAVGATAGLVVLGKPNGYALLVPTAAWIVWATVRGRVSLRALAAAAGLGLVVCAPVLAWNTIRTSGDPLGLERYADYISRTGNPRGLSTRMLLVTLAVTANSAFARFGAMAVLLPRPFYFAWGALVATGAGLWLARSTLAPVDELRATGRRGLAWLASALAVGLALVVWNATTVDYQPQGRYVLLPVLVATLAAVLAPSHAQPGSRLGAALPRAALTLLAAACATAMVLLWTTPCG
jgi:4-amino-4-deoxy-L-arabinose transferase-like glycosyltransferase